MAAAQAAAGSVLAAGVSVAAGCQNGASSSVNIRTSVVFPSPTLKPRSVSISSSTFGSSLERSGSFSHWTMFQQQMLYGFPGFGSYTSHDLTEYMTEFFSFGWQITKDSAHGITTSATKLEVVPVVEEEKEVKPTESSAPIATEASVSSFMTDVANLVKLVDSRDIIELEMKHKNYEIVIRKKEALAPPPPPPASFPGPHVMAHTSFPGYPAPPMSPPPAAAAAPVPAEVAPAVPAAPPASQHPPMLSPMAGTFYRSPGPGEAPFVQVGDKVTKGQVVCIVEAMKLMNEIEADQSGTIVEIVAEDAKPVSIESPLFIIKP